MTSVAEVLNKSGITEEEWSDMKSMFLVSPEVANQYQSKRDNLASSVDNQVKDELNGVGFNQEEYISTKQGTVLPFKSNENLDKESVKSGFNVVNNLRNNGVPVEAGTPIFKGGTYKDETVVRARNDSMLNDKKCVTQMDSECDYKSRKFTSEGKTKDYSVHTDSVNWNGYFTGDCERDFDSLRLLVSTYINKRYGFNNIRTIVVRDSTLIINDSLCFPKLDRTVLESLPADCKDYFLNGSIATFFDWGNLSRLSNLRVLDFDSQVFVNDWVLPDLGWGGALDNKIYKAIFYNSRIERLIIGRQVITRKELNEIEKSRKIEQKARWKAIHNEIIANDKKAFKGLYKSADDWRKWQWGTVKKFATNRGKKGFLKYSFGIIGRVGLALAVTPITYSPRLVRSLVSTVKYAASIVSDS